MQTSLLNLMADRLGNAFCGMLIHSLWQGLLLGLFAGVARAITKKWKAAARYQLACSLFAVFLLVCLLTFFWQWNQNGSAIPASGAFGIQVVTGHFNDWLAAHENKLLLVWLVIFCIRIIQMAVALWYNQQMLYRKASPPNLQWQQVFERLCKILKIERTVTLLESGYMKIPVVTGHLKPFVLVPLGLLSSLTPDQAEAILLHELAHIRRNDWLVNLIQHIAVSIFFFHPAVFLVSAWIKEEREYCCDDIAIGQTSNKAGMVEALIRFKEYNLYASACQTAFPGNKNQLLRRVQYIAGHKNIQPDFSARLFYLTLFAVLFTGTTICMLNKGFQQPATKLTPVSAIIPPVIMQPLPVDAVKTESIKKTKASKKRTGGYKKNELAEAVAREAMNSDYEEQAIKDQQQAKLDQEKSMIDQQQAKKAQVLALDDMLAAKLQQEKAMRDDQQAKTNQQGAELARQKVLQDERRAKADQERVLNQQKEAARMQLKHQPGN